MRFIFIPDENMDILLAAHQSASLLFQEANYQLTLKSQFLIGDELDDYKKQAVKMKYLLGFVEKFHNKIEINLKQYIDLKNMFNGIDANVNKLFDAMKVIDHQKSSTIKNYSLRTNPNFMVNFLKHKYDSKFREAKESGKLGNCILSEEKENATSTPTFK